MQLKKEAVQSKQAAMEKAWHLTVWKCHAPHETKTERLVKTVPRKIQMRFYLVICCMQLVTAKLLKLKSHMQLEAMKLLKSASYQKPK